VELAYREHFPEEEKLHAGYVETQRAFSAFRKERQGKERRALNQGGDPPLPFPHAAYGFAPYSLTEST